MTYDPLNNKSAREAAKAYNAHHFSCPTCCAAGMNNGQQRCPTGQALHQKYMKEFNK